MPLANKQRRNQPYQNALVEFDRFKAISDLYARPSIARAVFWSQGEQDDVDGTTYAAYYAALEQLHADYDADIKARLGQADDVHFIMDPPAAGGTNGFGRQSALAQYAYARANAQVHIATPKYFMGYGDQNHLKAIWYAIRGEYYAKCWRALFVDGATWTGLRYSAISRIGTTIEITTEGRVDALVKDTTTVPAAPDDGFVYTGANITNVALAGNTITLTIDADAAGSLSYAWDNPGTLPGLPYAGAIGNIRDSDTAPSYAGNVDYPTLPNWLQSFGEVAL